MTRTKPRFLRRSHLSTSVLQSRRVTSKINVKMHPKKSIKHCESGIAAFVLLLHKFANVKDLELYTYSYMPVHTISE